MLFLMEHGAWAPLVVFSMICLTGCMVPISEDIVILASGWLAGAIMPERALLLFTSGLAGAYIADLGIFYSGRAFTRAQVLGWRQRLVQRAESAKQLLHRWGLPVLILGRFIPFGFRTGLFFTAGLSRMSPLRFAIVNIVGCLCTHTLLFGAAFWGQHYIVAWLPLIKRLQLALFLLVLALLSVGWLLWHRRRARSR